MNWIKIVCYCLASLPVLFTVWLIIGSVVNYRHGDARGAVSCMVLAIANLLFIALQIGLGLLSDWVIVTFA